MNRLTARIIKLEAATLRRDYNGPIIITEPRLPDETMAEQIERLLAAGAVYHLGGRMLGFPVELTVDEWSGIFRLDENDGGHFADTEAERAAECRRIDAQLQATAAIFKARADAAGD